MIGELCVPRLALGTIAWTPERSGSAAQSFRPGDAMDSKAGTTHAQRAAAQLSSIPCNKSAFYFSERESRVRSGEEEDKTRL